MSRKEYTSGEIAVSVHPLIHTTSATSRRECASSATTHSVLKIGGDIVHKSVGLLAALLVLLLPAPGISQEANPPEQEHSVIENQGLDEEAEQTERPPETNRTEIAPFPSLGYNSDVGFIFGVNVALVRLDENYSPHRFRMQIIAEASVKTEGDNVIFPRHRYLYRLDMPGLLHDRLRINLEAGFERISNSGYYGLAGLSSTDPLGREELRGGRQLQFVRMDARARLDMRWKLPRSSLPLEILTGFDFSYIMPSSYTESVINDDLQFRQTDGDPVIVGFDYQPLFILKFGVLWDSRDNEVIPTQGFYGEASVRGGMGFPHEDFLGFGAVTADIRFYSSLIRSQHLVLAIRFLFDTQFGDVPFTELAMVGTFFRHAFCGAWGVRGSPDGRHMGKTKLLGALELRSFFLPFRLFRMNMNFGVYGIMTAGQCWVDLSPEYPQQDTGPSASFGVGGGVLLKWGEAIIIRVEVLYSPDATDLGMPVGIYSQVGFAF